MRGTFVLFRNIFCLAITVALFVNRAHAHDTGDLKTFVNFEGQVEVMVSDDFETKKSTKHYIVKDHTGKKKVLQLPAGMKDPNLTSGQQVAIKGHFHSSKSDKIYVDQPVAALGGDSAAIGIITAPASTSNILTIIADFNDGTVACTDSQVQNIMFSADPAAFSVANYYQETSKGKLAVQGQVVRVKISQNIGACDSTTMNDPNRWMSAARTEAAKQISLSGYTNTLLVLPSNTPCPWSGLGNLGWGGSAWVKTCQYGSVYAHEFGHNLGMHHASSPGADYGDGSDVMGGGYAPVNAPHSISRGWTPLANVLEVKSSGVYRVSSLETDPAAALAPQALKIFKQDTNEYYYFSLREAVGVFGQRIISTNYANRLNVHTHGARQETVIQGTRGVGEAYVDSVNGITVTPIAINGNQMDVQIDISAPCIRKAPTFSVSALSGVIAGQLVSNYVYIQNNDSYFCPSTTFNVGVSSLPGLAASTEKSSVEINSGTGGYYLINIQTDALLANGTYNLSTTAVDSADSSRSLSASFAVSVGVTTTVKKGKGRRR